MKKSVLVGFLLIGANAFAGTPGVIPGTVEYIVPTHSESYLEITGDAAKALAADIAAKPGKSKKVIFEVECTEGAETCDLIPTSAK